MLPALKALARKRLYHAGLVTAFSKAEPAEWPSELVQVTDQEFIEQLDCYHPEIVFLRFGYLPEDANKPCWPLVPDELQGMPTHTWENTWLPFCKLWQKERSGELATHRAATPELHQLISSLKKRKAD